MSYSDPDRDQRIADLETELAELRGQHNTLHAMWRAGLHLAQDRNDTAMVATLSGY